MDLLQQQLDADPKRAAKMQKIEEATRAFRDDPERVIDGIITIPVVFHIVWNTATENISDAQIASQLQILTDDFRRFNSDADGTWPQAADTEIEFCMATSDPNGNATTGITRTNTSVTSFSTNDNVKFDNSGGKDAWPASDYMNFWVCDLSGGLLGYAQFPGGPASTDGIVCDYQYVGDIGTATSPYELGRTATHEVGHWLNLRHIWGDGGCGQDDQVGDTPVSDASNGGCPTGHVSCGTVDMVQNYMDYTFDACMNLFTQGQKTRMRALFDNGGARASLLTSTACGPVTPPTCDDGLQNGEETGVDCGGPACPECPPCEGTDVVLTIVLDEYPEETSWAVLDGNGVTIATGGTYGSLPDFSTVTEIICLPNGCYDFTIYDTFGDGICCEFGNGSYELVDPNGNVLASGGEFTDSETTNFCVNSTPIIPGCTDQSAHNYDPTATIDDGTCETCSDGFLNGDEEGIDCGGILCGPCIILGCMDPSAHNFDINATEDDGSCETCNDGLVNGDETGIDCGGVLCGPCSFTGCTDPNAHNYNPNASDDDGSCETCNDNVMNGDETGVDCGGELCEACSSCNDILVTLTIVMDRYPEETSWALFNDSGENIESGGPYGDMADYATYNETFCLEENCYAFSMYDVYGDGLCCAFGNGSYSLVDDAGNILASGGSFGYEEVTKFCIGEATVTEGCTDPDAHNYNPAAILDDGSCETCSDEIMNGDETGVDCGGELCAPCDSQDCTYEGIDFNDFDNEWGIWNDGGSDCRRSSSDDEYAHSDPYCIRLRDNSSSSVMTTDNLNMSPYDELTVDFTYFPRSMENNEDFWLQVSTNGGSSYTTVGSWARGTDFENNIRYFESVVIEGPFSNTTRLRFRCDASGNSDYVYIDDVDITGCDNGSNDRVATAATTVEPKEEEMISIGNIFPNPSSSVVNVSFHSLAEKEATAQLFDVNGKLIYSEALTMTGGKQIESFDVSGFGTGIYFFHLTTDEQRMVKRFVVARQLDN